MKIAILGGYGNTGIRIAKLLAEHSTVSIILLGRNGEKAEKTAVSLGNQTGRDVTGLYADASKPETLLPVLSDADMIVVASSSSDCVKQVAQAALNTNTDYLDINLSTAHKIETLRSMEGEIVTKQLCFITDGGFHPGVPAAMVHYAAQHIPTLTHANVGGSFQVNWKELHFSDNTITEFVTELLEMDYASFVNGRWQKTWKNMKQFDFGGQAGRRQCAPFFMEEMRELPKQFPTLRETGFFIAGFSPVFDYVVMPVCFVLAKLLPKRPDIVGRLFLSGLRRFASKNQWALLRLAAEGKVKEETAVLSLQLSHENGYDLTAIPIVACLRQYIAGHRSPGVWTQANFVEPVQFFQDIQQMGVDISLTINDQKAQLLTKMIH